MQIVSGYATLPVTKAPNWHGLVAWDMLLNNLSTGLFLAAALGELAAPTAFTAVAGAAYPVALLLLLADLVCLVLDLGDPLRFHHMLRVFKPTSPMSLGTWCLTAFSLPLTVLGVLWLLPEDGPTVTWVRRLAVVAGLLPALGAAVYKGVLFSTSSQPVWREARWLGAYLVSAAFLLGAAELLAVSIVMAQEQAMALLRTALAGLLLLHFVTLGLLWHDVRAALPVQRSRRLAVILLAGGVLVPLCLFLAGTAWTMLGGVVALVLSALVARFEVVYLPQTSPAKKPTEA